MPAALFPTNSSLVGEGIDILFAPSIVATVLKKFIPHKPEQPPTVEDTGTGEKPPILQAPESKNITQPKSVMTDTSNKNLLSNDVEIKGSIKFVNEFTFDGKLEGEISSTDGVLTVGENGDVRGEVKAKSVIVSGKVHGNITVQERCELRSRSQLIGDLKATRLIIEEGATFVGKSEVTPNKTILKDLGSHPKEEPHKVGVGAPR